MALNISIVIPVYNVEKFLSACLDSVLAQTFTEWEAICVDDGSTDRSGEILSAYAKRDSRIKVITQPNAGVSAARNFGMKHANGKLLCFLDSDDIIAPFCLYRLYDTLVSTSADIVCCGVVYGEKEPAWRTTSNQNLKFLSGIDCIKKTVAFDGSYAGLWGKLFRREMVEGLCFPEDLGTSEDRIFLCKAFLRAKKVVGAEETVYFYRQREGSIVHSGLSETRLRDLCRAEEVLFSWSKGVELPNETKEQINKSCSKFIFKYCYKLPKREDRKNLSKWYAISRPILAGLKERCVFQPKYLPLRNRIRLWFFTHGCDSVSSCCSPSGA